jgi:cytochrome c oxidase accessory protein FixG
MAILTFTTFFFGGFAREQICIYACPWPRIQAAMMDEDTLVVAYREWRGEPRGKLKKPGEEGAALQGDCIDCLACVNVCPMGIDIRKGQQLECITCALCIDACDEVMDRIGKPRGLIDYMALKDETAERAGQKPTSIWKHVFRPRTILYTTLWASIGVAMIVALFLRSPIGLNVSPVRNPLYVTLSDGTIRNTYEVRLHNKHGEVRPFHISLTALEPLDIELEGRENTVVDVPPDETVTQRVYVTAPPGSKAATGGQIDVRLWVVDLSVRNDRVHADTVFHGTGG